MLPKNRLFKDNQSEMVSHMRVEKVMTTEIDFVTVPGSREDVLVKIKETGHMGFPVVKRGTKKLVGFISRSDIMRHPGEDQLGLIMTRDPLAVRRSTQVAKAAEKMLAFEYLRLPVVEGDDLVGIITVTDIVEKVIMDLPSDMSIEPLIKRRVTCVWDKTPLTIALEIMKHAKKEVVPVLDDNGNLTGVVGTDEFIKELEIVSERKKSSITSGGESEKWAWDAGGILYITKRTLKLPDKQVREIMIKDVITAIEQNSVVEVAKTMTEKGLDQMPVLDATGEIIGVIRKLDLLKAILPKE